MAQELYSPKERGAILTGWLVFVGLANGWTVYRYVDIIRDYVQHSDPALNGPAGWAFPLLTVLALINIGAVVALFRWRKLGWYLILMTSGVALVVNLILGIPLILSLLGFGGLAILWWLLSRKWEHFT